MAVQDGYRKNSDASTETRLAREVYKDMMHLGEPTDVMLMTLKGGYSYVEGGAKPKEVQGKIKTEPTSAVEFEVIEKDPLSRALTVTGAHNDSVTTLTVGASATSAKNVTVGDLLYVKQTAEKMLVIAKAANGYDLTVRRGVSGSAASALVGGEDIVIYSWAGKEGGSKRSKISQLAAGRKQTTQIFKRSFGISETVANVELLTSPNDWDEEMTQAAYDHKLDIELSCWLGGGGSSTDADGNTVLFQKGVIPTIASDSERVLDCGKSLTESFFFGELMPKIFQYGPKQKTLIADSVLIAIINSFPMAKQQTTTKETDFGFDIQTLRSPFGTLNIALGGMFSNWLPASEQGYGVVLDLNNIVWRPLKNRDTKMKENIQTPGDDVREGQFITEGGIMVKMIKFHSIIRNVK